MPSLGPLSPSESTKVLAAAFDQANPAALRRAVELSGGSPTAGFARLDIDFS